MRLLLPPHSTIPAGGAEVGLEALTSEDTDGSIQVREEMPGGERASNLYGCPDARYTRYYDSTR